MNLKKCVLLLGFLVLAASQSFAQSTANAIDKYFKQYVEDERFTVVYISSKLFEMIGNIDAKNLDLEDKEAASMLEIAKDMQGLRILTSEEDAAELYAEAKAKIDTKEYEVLMTVRDKDGDNVDFLVKESSDNKIQELLLLVGGGEEFTLLSFIGNLDINKITQFAKEMEQE